MSMATQVTYLQSQIEAVLDRFDFDKTHRVMEFLNWEWSTTARGVAVPTISELKACARQLLCDAVNAFEKGGCPQAGMNVATGGFDASIDVFESGDVQLQLLFYVDCASAMSG